MEMKAVFKRVAPYADDEMNLPVRDVAAAIPYYEEKLGFRVVSRRDTPHPLVVLERDGIQIGLAENGGEPEQEGCFFEVDDIEAAYQEIKGAPPTGNAIKVTQTPKGPHLAFFEVAPDGLCYMLGQPVPK